MTDVIGETGKGNGRISRPDPEPGRVAQELTGLRREVIEARNLVIKTENLLKTFHIELKTIGTKQEAFERRHFLGHVAAYVVIGVLAAGGALLMARMAGEASRAQADELLTAAQQASERATAAEQQATALLASRAEAADQALGAYRLLRSGDPTDQELGLARTAALKMDDLDPFARAVLEGESGGLRRRLAESAYAAGMADYRRGRVREAAPALETYLTHAQHLPADEHGEERGLAMYYLGATYNQTGRHDDAVVKLRAYLATSPTGENAAYASLLLGDSLGALGRRDEARRAIEEGLARGATGQIERALRSRLATLTDG